MRALFVVALVGCVDGNAVPCDDGRLCPAGTVCRSYPLFDTGAHHDLCVPLAQIDACDGKAELAECSDGFACYQGACLPSGCGNSIPDPNEICDDSNANDGDGCSRDCLSLEVCRNGHVDFNEGCDDGNTLGNDGCSPLCVTERARWEDLDAPMPERQGTHFAYDQARDALVLFSGGTDARMFEWNDRRWDERCPDRRPSGRVGGAIAYDADRKRIVLFGSGSVNDTWEWDGVDWTQIPTMIAPPRRFYAAMAFDPPRHRIVLYGGTGDAEFDAWAWDGAQWTMIDAPSEPVSTPVMAWDPKRGVLVLAGTTDVWELDSSASATWRKIIASGGPIGTEFTWNPVDETLVRANGTCIDAQPWAQWNGTAWSAFPKPLVDNDPGDPLCGSPFTALTTRTATNEIIAVGSPLANELPETYAYGADRTWRVITSQVTPPDRRNGGSTLDPIRRRIIIGGGFSADISNQDFMTDYWAWDGMWKRLPGVGPTRQDHALAYDPKRDRLVLFGGRMTATLSNEIWEYDGATWTRIATPAIAPAPRYDAAIVWDTKAEEIVIFGGFGVGTRLGDTWSWNGTTWRERSSTGPSPRETSMAWDPVHERAVLFGGSSAAGLLADTWILDGDTWTEVVAPDPPGRRSTPLAWNPARQRVVLDGSDLWEFDGARWQIVEIVDTLEARKDHVFVEDPEGRGIVVYGGVLETEPIEDLARLAFTSNRTDRCLGGDEDLDGLAGCEDPDCWWRCAPTCPPGTSCP